MKKLFSIASWNIEHLRDNDISRIKRVINFINASKPDIVGIYEVEAKNLFPYISDMMPNYQFHTTEGKQSQEIVIGVKNRFSAFFTQKTEFKSGLSYLRPGALLNIRIDKVNYPILFLHLKSMTKPIGLGVRDDQITRAFSFKRKVLDKMSSNNDHQFIILGDLNTMGMDYLKKGAIKSEEELERISKYASKVDMRILTKSSDFTWSKGSKSRYKPSNLDNVIASNILKFRLFNGHEVNILGWPTLSSDSKKDKWINDYSDHALLYVELQKP